MTTQHHTTEQKKETVNTEVLVADFKALIADAENLIKATANQEEGPLSAIRSKTMETLNSAKENFSEIEGTLTDKAKEVADTADEFVHRSPWQAVGVAAGLGLLIGLLISRR